MRHVYDGTGNVTPRLKTVNFSNSRLRILGYFDNSHDRRCLRESGDGYNQIIVDEKRRSQYGRNMMIIVIAAKLSSREATCHE